MATIKAPDPYYCGMVGRVHFRDGAAETDDAETIAFCRSAGYEILDDDGAPVPPPEAVADAPAANATQEAWADWVIATYDLDEAYARSLKREQLREQYGPKPE